jgi:predicted transcriptional regulator
VDSTFNWKPEQTLLEKLTNFARQRGQSPETIVSEAVRQYLETKSRELNIDTDEIVLSDRDWDVFESALVNPPEPNEALKAAIKENQGKYGKW